MSFIIVLMIFATLSKHFWTDIWEQRAYFMETSFPRLDLKALNKFFTDTYKTV